jgi:short-subunit dehydrogenase
MGGIASPVLIIGARSDIAAALAHAYGARGCDLILAARDPEALATAKADLEIRHRVTVRLVACDVTAPDPEPFFDGLGETPGTVVMVAGFMGDQNQSAADPSLAQVVMETNYNGPARILLTAARRMAERGSGAIIGISSVAGDRGRASNFIYGSAKAGFTAFLSGLRGAMVKSGVSVITVKPGYVATRMTAGMTLPAPLTAQPGEVAEAIVRAQLKDHDLIYVRPIWLPIMTIIRLVPERLFKRMKI